jgi:hypothetical protein
VSRSGVRAARIVTIGTAAALVFGAAFLIAWTWPAGSAGPCTVAAGPARLPGIEESSGLAVSRRTPGVLWSHNDSGYDAVLFALDTAGALRGRVRVPIRTRDWEDVSAAPCPSGDCLYIADIGDNRRNRPRIQIYRVAEPAPGDAETAAPEVFNASYADGPHNAEAMFVAGANLVIVTRERGGGVYRATIASTGSRDLTFQPIGDLGLSAPVSDAEASRDGASVVVRTSREIVFYRTDDLTRGSSRPYFRILIEGLREPQGEGVAIDGNMLFLSSEGRPWTRGGVFMSLRCELPQ